MHRPTKQHRQVVQKIEQKKARSRKTGKKAKRWAKWAESYGKLSNDAPAGGEEKQAKGGDKGAKS